MRICHLDRSEAEWRDLHFASSSKKTTGFSAPQDEVPSCFGRNDKVGADPIMLIRPRKALIQLRKGAPSAAEAAWFYEIFGMADHAPSKYRFIRASLGNEPIKGVAPEDFQLTNTPLSIPGLFLATFL